MHNGDGVRRQPLAQKPSAVTRADAQRVEEPRRYLGTVVTRLCLDRMKSARARREIYVGQP
jgi:DNA-directed RNA polymerase specialized sigma24 family protein